jgi:hypothetical protein
LLLRERGTKTEESSYEKINLLKEIELWKEKALESEEKMKLTVAEEQNRAT